MPQDNVASSSVAGRHGELPVRRLTSGELPVRQLTSGELPVRQLTSGELPVRQLTSGEMNQPPPAVDTITFVRDIVNTAVREKRVFSVHGYYPSVRLALKRRGWLEKRPTDSAQLCTDDDIDVQRWPLDVGCLRRPVQRQCDEHDATATKSAPAVVSASVMGAASVARLLREHKVNLQWTARRDLLNFTDFDKDHRINHFPHTPFTTKTGLCGLSRQLHWFSDQLPPADQLILRSYQLHVPDDRQLLIDDFRLSACIGLLLCFCQRYRSHGMSGVVDSFAQIAFSTVDTALSRCRRHLSGHHSLPTVDKTTAGTSVAGTAEAELTDAQWTSFLAAVEGVTVVGAKMCVAARTAMTDAAANVSLASLVHSTYCRAAETVTAMQRCRPFTLADGFRNLWIVKPAAASRGRGISLTRSLGTILNYGAGGGKYVVQKYMERPLLIHDVKFDIRQWFLVTDWNPLTVWIYKMSYARFASQPFSLDSLCEAVHLCNNAVQCRYTNAARHPQLPDDNMWDSGTLQQYLRGESCGDHVWHDVIYSGMKTAIVAVCLAAQMHVDRHSGCFELFGADFILSSTDFKPYLIEVNACPAMGPSTNVTSWMCSMCLEDVIRVVVDRRTDPQADVGEFEPLLQGESVPRPRYSGAELVLYGRRVVVSANSLSSTSSSASSCLSAAAVQQRRRRRRCHKRIGA